VASKVRKKPTLHSLSRLPINLETYFKELLGESDRACALIAAAAISDKLCELLKLYFVKLNETDINHLFYDQGAPFGDFASQTDISFALGLISPQERHIVNIIRKIRNVFAHTLAQIDFSHELVTSTLSKISPGKPLPNMEAKQFFATTFVTLYLALRARGMYMTKQRSGLAGGGRVPIYELAKLKRGHGMVAPD
jgi:mannitol operon repressor